MTTFETAAHIAHPAAPSWKPDSRKPRFIKTVYGSWVFAELLRPSETESRLMIRPLLLEPAGLSQVVVMSTSWLLPFVQRFQCVL